MILFVFVNFNFFVEEIFRNLEIIVVFKFVGIIWLEFIKIIWLLLLIIILVVVFIVLFLLVKSFGIDK